jgi:Domain of unknown function (DUF1818)
MTNKIIKSGENWRIGWDSNATNEYNYLIGGENWAFELTTAEITDFYHLLSQLIETMQQISTELMEEETITIDAETDLLWMQIEGYPHDYNLYFIIHSPRRTEGNFPSIVIPHLMQALQMLQVF